MRPWQHARSSAGKDGDWVADLPIHEFMDSTKAACPDLRHRMVLHNADLGPELAARLFPERADARTIAMRHVEEDLGCMPTLADWVAACDPSRLPRPLSRRLPLSLEDVSGQIARQQGLRDETESRAVLELMMLPVQLAGLGAMGVLLNGNGLAIARAVIGAPYFVPGRHGGQAMFDPAYAAETLIQHLFGTIPTLFDVVSAVRHHPTFQRET